MGKKQAAAPAATAVMPEFHIVVKRPPRKGPIAPYRFAVSVVVALFVTYDELMAMLGGTPGDVAILKRVVFAGAFVWFVLTILNKILANTPDDDAKPAEPGLTS